MDTTNGLAYYDRHSRAYRVRLSGITFYNLTKAQAQEWNKHGWLIDRNGAAMARRTIVQEV